MRPRDLLSICTIVLFLSGGATRVQPQNSPEKSLTAQSACKVYFTVSQLDPHLPGGSLDGMSDVQKKWWKKKGVKKFPTACYDPTKATYKIAWWRETVSDNFVSKNVVNPKYDSTVRRTRDIGYAYVKAAAAAETDKPLFYVDRDTKGTDHALEKAVEFLSREAPKK